jgi:hypothetical protein
MCAPKAPAPPDPRETSAAQTGTNIGTAVANNTMGLMDQDTPYGNLSYSTQGYETYKDPYTGESYEIPRYKATQTLNGQQQATLDQNQAAQYNLGALANERSEFLRDYLPNSEAATDQIDSKLYDLGAKRLDPRFAQARDTAHTRLANQGITQGSEAYNREMDLLGNQENDAYNQLLLNGRGQAMSEVNMPLNQITALLSGSQVSNPNTPQTSPQGAATTDVAGMINNNYSQQMQNYNTQMQQHQSLMGGMFGLGAAGITGGMFNPGGGLW